MGLGEQITIPCKVGDKFWIIAYSDPKVIQVECIGYTIGVDIRNRIGERVIWVESVDRPQDYWKIKFSEFESSCFDTKEEAELHLSDSR